MPHKHKYTKTDLQIHKYKYTVEDKKNTLTHLGLHGPKHTAKQFNSGLAELICQLLWLETKMLQTNNIKMQLTIAWTNFPYSQ